MPNKSAKPVLWFFIRSKTRYVLNTCFFVYSGIFDYIYYLIFGIKKNGFDGMLKVRLCIQDVMWR